MKIVSRSLILLTAVIGMTCLYAFNTYSPGNDAEGNAKSEYERQKSKAEQEKNEEKQNNKEVIQEHRKEVQKKEIQLENIQRQRDQDEMLNKSPHS